MQLPACEAIKKQHCFILVKQVCPVPLSQPAWSQFQPAKFIIKLFIQKSIIQRVRVFIIIQGNITKVYWLPSLLLEILEGPCHSRWSLPSGTSGDTVDCYEHAHMHLPMLWKVECRVWEHMYKISLQALLLAHLQHPKVMQWQFLLLLLWVHRQDY